jgi:hypothetical protein
VLKRTFNITLEEYSILLDKQNNKCKICNKDQSEFKKAFAVDHCHRHEEETGEIKIRGLLCANCNKGIGNLQENIEILNKAIIYLQGE